MGKCFKYLALAFLFGVNPAEAGAAELMATHPSHYAHPGEALQGSGGSILGHTKQARPGSHVIVRDPDALQARWVLNAELSHACNKRLFRQKRDRYLIGIIEGRTYGAAVGGHGSLLDRARLAEDKVIYLFQGQGTTDCRVWHRTR